MVDVAPPPLAEDGREPVAEWATLLKFWTNGEVTGQIDESERLSVCRGEGTPLREMARHQKSGRYKPVPCVINEPPIYGAESIPELSEATEAAWYRQVTKLIDKSRLSIRAHYGRLALETVGAGRVRRWNNNPAVCINEAYQVTCCVQLRH
jgi:hypothetical protein